MVGERSHRMASRVANAHGAPGDVPDSVGHALLLVLVAVLSLIALPVGVAHLEPPKGAQGRRSPVGAAGHLRMLA